MARALSVQFVIGLMADGWSEAVILANYAGITHEDILACFAYARETLSAERVFPASPEVRLSADTELLSSGWGALTTKINFHDDSLSAPR